MRDEGGLGLGLNEGRINLGRACRVTQLGIQSPLHLVDPQTKIYLKYYLNGVLRNYPGIKVDWDERFVLS